MDMESSTSPAAGELEMKRRRLVRTCARWRALLAVCVAAVLAVVVLSSVEGSAAALSDSLSWVGWKGSEECECPELDPEPDQLLDGLLTPSFSSRSCLSRYQFANYHKKSHHKPSSYLLQKLRKQEALQKRCGPGTAAYKKALRQLKSGDGVNATDCYYLVSISYRGIGNRMLALTSAFLYAVLAERVLLVDRYGDVDALFCEPFPATSWLLPSGGFPLKHLSDFDLKSKESFGNLLKSGAITVDGDGGQRPPYVYLHIEGGYGFYDKLFYCDEHQRRLQSVPWLLMRTDSYIVPGLFLVPSLQDELGRMFPEMDTVFYHLGRYLFHPTNTVWRAVTSYYNSHLAGADHRVGIQIRVFDRDRPFQHVLDQILSCLNREKLIPTETNSNMSQAVLITSLSSWHSQKIKQHYHEKVLGVYQPSHEEHQQWGSTRHDTRALTEIYLLSMTDVLVTSGFSTFGYVAQGLGGLMPWIMEKPEKGARTAPEPPCGRAMSVEPCFHSPPYYDCAAKRDRDSRRLVPYVRQCEDVSWGLKLVNGSKW